ncbi:MAG TPA: ThuA domain-containing protein [Bryobacteraceae bacterium]|nr:ThuA domain-containing protein [Bryobacteraceae bacterium]
MLRTAALVTFLCSSALAAQTVLIVADEVPAMQVLASKLKAGAGVDSRIIQQTALPPDMAKYPAVFVYIHRTLNESAEVAFIDYAKNGGKLILLHHSISSGKRGNKYWFPFLGISLPTGDFAAGGYKYFEGITDEIVNLAPTSYVTTHDVHYTAKIRYKNRDLPGFQLDDTEVYINHVWTAPKEKLLGVKFTDPSGQVHEQDTAGWHLRTEKGQVYYFMPGHSSRDFENPVYSQIIVNALTAK